MSEEKCGSGGILLAFLAGGLVGAGLAILYAPASGRETRERITGVAEDLKKKTEQLTGDVKQKVEGFVEEDAPSSSRVRCGARCHEPREGPLRGSRPPE
jgi:gas vesicle protein